MRLFWEDIYFEDVIENNLFTIIFLILDLASPQSYNLYFVYTLRSMVPESNW